MQLEPTCREPASNQSSPRRIEELRRRKLPEPGGEMWFPPNGRRLARNLAWLLHLRGRRAATLAPENAAAGAYPQPSDAKFREGGPHSRSFDWLSCLKPGRRFDTRPTRISPRP